MDVRHEHTFVFVGVNYVTGLPPCILAQVQLDCKISHGSGEDHPGKLVSTRKKKWKKSPPNHPLKCKCFAEMSLAELQQGFGVILTGGKVSVPTARHLCCQLIWPSLPAYTSIGTPMAHQVCDFWTVCHLDRPTLKWSSIHFCGLFHFGFKNTEILASVLMTGHMMCCLKHFSWMHLVKFWCSSTPVNLTFLAFLFIIFLNVKIIWERNVRRTKKTEELCEKERKSPAELWTGDSTRHKGK